MVYAKLAYLALIACVCQVSDAQSLRRVRPGCTVPQVVPRVPAPASYCVYDGCDRCRCECKLEEIISKLVNALIYTTLRNGGGGVGSGYGGVGGGSGGGVGGGSGGGAGGSNGGGGGGGNGGSESSNLLSSLLELEILLGGINLADVNVLPGISRDNSP